MARSKAKAARPPKAIIMAAAAECRRLDAVAAPLLDSTRPISSGRDVAPEDMRVILSLAYDAVPVERLRGAPEDDRLGPLYRALPRLAWPLCATCGAEARRMEAGARYCVACWDALWRARREAERHGHAGECYFTGGWPEAAAAVQRGASLPLAL